jgi:hypothetical protein
VNVLVEKNDYDKMRGPKMAGQSGALGKSGVPSALIFGRCKRLPLQEIALGQGFQCAVLMVKILSSG